MQDLGCEWRLYTYYFGKARAQHKNVLKAWWTLNRDCPESKSMGPKSSINKAADNAECYPQYRRSVIICTAVKARLDEFNHAAEGTHSQK